MSKSSKKSRFTDLNDFLIDRTDIRESHGGLRGVIFEPKGLDPLEPLALSKREGLTRLYDLVDELRNDLHEIRVLPAEYYSDKDYEKVRFKLYVIIVMCIANAVLYRAKAIIESREDWETSLNETQLKNYNNLGGRLHQRIKYTLMAFVQVFELEIKPDFQGVGWKGFIEAIKIREQLIHPSSMNAMSVDQQKVTFFIAGWNWFSEFFTAVLVSYCKKFDLIYKLSEYKSVGRFTSDGLSGLRASDFPTRDLKQTSKERMYRAAIAMGAKGEGRESLGLLTSVMAFKEDCIHLSTGNVAFKIRAIVFASFAEIETMVSLLKRRMISKAQSIGPVSMKKIADYLQLTGPDGSLINKELRTFSFKDKLRKIPDLLAIGSDVEWQFKDHQDVGLIDYYIALRDRLHHPKSLEDISINQIEFERMMSAHRHLVEQFNGLIVLTNQK